MSLLAHATALVMLTRAPAGQPERMEIGAVVVSLTSSDTPASDSQPTEADAPKKVEQEAAVEPKAPPPPTDASIPDTAAVVPDTGAEDLWAPDATALSVAAAAGGAEGEPCQLTLWLQQALQDDPRVQAALPAIPRPARSVANALMLWDGSWVEPAAMAQAGQATIRAAITAGIGAAPAACQNQLIRGPELMTLTAGSDVTVIAVGSGEWRWSNLLTEDVELAQNETAAACQGHIFDGNAANFRSRSDPLAVALRKALCGLRSSLSAPHR